MATSFVSLFRDITALMDDVATLTQAATKRTAGVIVDDLVVNSEQASGFSNSREWPIVFKIFMGSLLNKVILVPIALIMGAVYPPFMTALLIAGALYLAYEGFEGAVELYQEYKGSAKQIAENECVVAAAKNGADMLLVEKYKIRSAILTDFVLSAEIIVIAYGAILAQQPEVTLAKLALALSTVAIAITVIVYGVVALLVKVDDVGLWLTRFPKTRAVGMRMINTVPYLMRGLTWAGVIAMLMVAGGIFAEHSPAHALYETIHHLPYVGSVLAAAVAMVIALIVGKIMVTVHHLFEKSH